MRINKSVIRELKALEGENIILPVTMLDREFEIEIQTKFTPLLREKMLEQLNVFDDESLKEYGEVIVGLFTLVKCTTNIEWENNLEDDMEIFFYLTEQNIISQVLDRVPEDLVNEMAAHFNEMNSAVQEMAESEIEE